MIMKDFGKVNIPTKWEDVSVGQYVQLQNLVEESKEVGVDKYKVLSIFIDIDIEEIYTMPIQFVDKMMSNLLFLQQEPQFEPRNEIWIDGEKYFINYAEQMKVKEYEDIDTIVKNDSSNLGAMLAILCRKKIGEYTDPLTKEVYEQNEEYNSFFANTQFDKRMEYFNNLPITDALPLIAFFLLRGDILLKSSQDYTTEMKRTIDLCVQDTENSLKNMGFKKWCMIPRMMKLRKWKRYLKSI